MLHMNQFKLMLVFIIILFPSLSFTGEVNLPETGQTICYNTNGNIVDCTNTGQDGDIQAGVEWPSPRFVDNGDGTVTDNLTGLMWLKDANCFGEGHWQVAIDMVSDFNTNPDSYNCTDYTANYTDWVLPNIIELESLVNLEEPNPASWLNTQGFSNVQAEKYWSATTNQPNYDFGWNVGMGGYIGYAWKTYYTFHIWPVRDIVYAKPAQTWQTGQTDSYATGDDGDLQHGVSWPTPRFEDNGNGTITDHLTRLIWLKDANCGGTMTWDNALSFSNNLASDSCGLTDGSVAGDWHLPNRKELLSLIDFSRHDPALPQEHMFDNLQSSEYWSSTTGASERNTVWAVKIGSGGSERYMKSQYFKHLYVWPVRSGQLNIDSLVAILRKTDLDNDGDNDGSDLSIFVAAYGSINGGSNYNLNADFDDDGDVDKIDLRTFLRMFGSSDIPIVLPKVPVLNQRRYTDNENYPETFVESIANIIDGGCVPVSFAMLFLGHYNEFGPSLPAVDTSYNSQNTLNLMDDITQKLSVLIPVDEWQVLRHWSVDQTRINETQIVAFMDNYSFTFESTDYVVEADWDIDFECATTTSNDQLIMNILDRLRNNESIFFLGYINKLDIGEAGNHASIISGYAKIDGIEYFRVNDTYSDIYSWYRIERGDVCVANESCSTNYCPIKLIGNGGDWVFELRWRIAWPQSLVFTVVPKY